nr:hypothetical protein [Tanacetum cinerariifolium]
MSVLESGENATLKKRLDKIETKLVWARMEHETAKRRLHESRVWNKRFYLDMVHIRAVPKLPSDDKDTERQRKKSKNSTSDGTEGPFEPRGPPSKKLFLVAFWCCVFPNDCVLSQDCVLPLRFEGIAFCLKTVFCLCVLKSLRFVSKGCDLPPSCILPLRFGILKNLLTNLNGEPDLPVLVPKSFYEQTDEELTKIDIKQMDADDQAIQTILLGLPKDVYAAIASCEIAKEI